MRVAQVEEIGFIERTQSAEVPVPYQSVQPNIARFCRSPFTGETPNDRATTSPVDGLRRVAIV